MTTQLALKYDGLMGFWSSVIGIAPMGNLATIQLGCYTTSRLVRVVNPDGKTLVFKGEAVRVGDVLRSYPDHYVTEAGRECRPRTRGSVLKDEEILKPGLTYSLEPLPRMFSAPDLRPDSRKPSWKCDALTNCCAGMASRGFALSPVSTTLDNMDRSQGHREEECSVIGSLDPTFSMEFTCKGKTSRSNQKASKIPAALPPHLQELFKNADIEWKEIQDLSTAWKPDLDSIKEEVLPDRQTLAWLMMIESESEDWR